MPTSFRFEDVVGRYVHRSGYGLGQLSRLSGIPKRTLANWVNGRTKRPRNHYDLLKLATSLRLSESDTTTLLQSAQYPTVAQLIKQMRTPQQQQLLSPWAHAVRKRLDEAPFQAIADLPFFVGRQQEIEAIEAALLNGRHALICSLQGMGGIGKTTLAAHLAYRLRPHFPDGVLWARVDTADTMSILQSFASAYQGRCEPLHRYR